MDRVTHFVINHWPLWAALAVILLLIVFEETKGSAKGVAKINPQQMTHLINHDNAVIVDVRKGEVFDHGHIAGAVNIAADDFASNIGGLSKYKDRPVILVCDVGTAAVRFGVTLRKREFTKIYSLNGGIAAWQKAGLPLVKN